MSNRKKSVSTVVVYLDNEDQKMLANIVEKFPFASNAAVGGILFRIALLEFAKDPVRILEKQRKRNPRIMRSTAKA